MSRSSLRVTMLLACSAALLSGCRKEPRAKVEFPISGKLRLDGVTLVDTHDGKLTPGMSILMDKGRIVGITPTAQVSKDPLITAIDATGRFAVPGFNNMHMHVIDQANSSAVLATMLADGVTGFRQMTGSPEFLEGRRNGTLPIGKDAPALLVMPGNLLTLFDAASTDQVVDEIREQKTQGADFIKVGLVSPEVFFAAIAEGNRVGLPVLGHLQEGVDAAQASRAGFRSIEHLGPGTSIWIACSTDEAVLLADAARHPIMTAPPIKVPAFLQKMLMNHLKKRLINPAAFNDAAHTARLQRAFDSYSEAKCRALAAVFVANQTWNVPTLVRLRTQELADSPEYLRDPALPYIPAESLEAWREVTDKFHKLPPAMHDTYREAYQRQLALTKLFDDAGVPMMVGTDGGGQVPGQSIHQEFDELAKAGLSPLKILQMTTLNPAEFLDRTATMGSIDLGKNADIVLLDGNPVESVQSLHRISGVVRAGFYYSRADLDALMERSIRLSVISAVRAGAVPAQTHQRF
jgi:imidazolonepropionase-like amidohydrolase